MAMQKLTIAASGTTTGEFDFGRFGTLARIDFPAAMTGTAVAIHAPLGDGDTFAACQTDVGVALSVSVVASTPVILYADDYRSIHRGKLVSNGTEAAERTIYVWSEAINGAGLPV